MDAIGGSGLGSYAFERATRRSVFSVKKVKIYERGAWINFFSNEILKNNNRKAFASSGRLVGFIVHTGA